MCAINPHFLYEFSAGLLMRVSHARSNPSSVGTGAALLADIERLEVVHGALRQVPFDIAPRNCLLGVLHSDQWPLRNNVHSARVVF